MTAECVFISVIALDNFMGIIFIENIVDDVYFSPVLFKQH